MATKYVALAKLGDTKGLAAFSEAWRTRFYELHAKSFDNDDDFGSEMIFAVRREPLPFYDAAVRGEAAALAKREEFRDIISMYDACHALAGVPLEVDLTRLPPAVRYAAGMAVLQKSYFFEKFGHTEEALAAYETCARHFENDEFPAAKEVGERAAEFRKQLLDGKENYCDMHGPLW